VSFDIEPPLQHVESDAKRKNWLEVIATCWRRIDGDWLIAHDQVSVPLDLKSGAALLKLEP